MFAGWSQLLSSGSGWLPAALWFAFSVEEFQETGHFPYGDPFQQTNKKQQQQQQNACKILQPKSQSLLFLVVLHPTDQMRQLQHCSKSSLHCQLSTWLDESFHFCFWSCELFATTSSALKAQATCREGDTSYNAAAFIFFSHLWFWAFREWEVSTAKERYSANSKNFLLQHWWARWGGGVWFLFFIFLESMTIRENFAFLGFLLSESSFFRSAPPSHDIWMCLKNCCQKRHFTISSSFLGVSDLCSWKRVWI